MVEAAGSVRRGAPGGQGAQAPEASSMLPSVVQGRPQSAAPEAHSRATAGGGGAQKSKEKAGPVKPGESPPLKPNEAAEAAVALAFLGLQLLPGLGCPRALQGSSPGLSSCREQ